MRIPATSARVHRSVVAGYVPDIIDADLDLDLDLDIPIPGPPGIGAPGPPGGSGQGDRISGVLDQHPDLAVGVVVGVAVGDARSSGTLARSVTRQQRAVMRQQIRVCSRPVELTLSPMVYSSMVHVAGGEGGSTRHDDEMPGPAPRVDLAQSTALKSPDFQATARGSPRLRDALPARRPRPRPGNCGGAVEAKFHPFQMANSSTARPRPCAATPTRQATT